MATPSNPTRVASRPSLWVLNPRRAGLLGWLFRYLAFTFLALLVLVGAGGVLLYRHFAATLPPLDAVAAYREHAPGVTRILAADGTLLAELAREHRSYASLHEIPEPLIQAFVATEDRRFYEHGGLDYRGLARALVANLRSGTVVQGGSTITQQVAKGILGDDRTLTRKIREAIASVRLENALTKDQILEVYLNKIFLGHGAYGVAAAASRYFDKDLDELTLAECALIAGLARAPSRTSPRAHPERALARRATVLRKMVTAGFITPAQQAEAEAEPLHLPARRDVFRWRAPYLAESVRRQLAATLGERTLLEDGLRIETALDLDAQRWAEAAVDRAVRKLDRRQGWRGPVAHVPDEPRRAALIEHLGRLFPRPLSDPDAWVLALVTETARREARVRIGPVEARLPLVRMRWAAPYDRNSGVNDRTISDVRDALVPGDVIWVQPVPPRAGQDPDPTALPVVRLGQTPRVEAALYTAELDTGYVVAMQGGHDYDRSQFNRPTQACRQPGSVFKAIYYALALDTGKWTMESILEDRPYEPEPGEEWNPSNIHGTLEGQVLLRNAFIYSLNLPSIRLFQRLGADAVVAWARRLGFTSEFIADKALSLGASCVRMEELARAFAIFGRGGRAWQPVYARRVLDKRGRVRLDHRAPQDPDLSVRDRLDRVANQVLHPPAQVVSETTAFLTTQMMRDVVTHGIGARAQRAGVPAAGKSGTASKNAFTTDTWFVGLTSRYVTVAWMGDDTYERSIGDEDASYTTATPLWTDFMKRLVAGVPHGPVPARRPAGITRKVVDSRTGGPPLPGQPTATLYLRPGG